MSAHHLHARLALVAEPLHLTADHNCGMHTGKAAAPVVLVDRVVLTLKFLLLTLITSVINLFAWAHETVILLCFPTRYAGRVLSLFFAHRFKVPIPADDDDDDDIDGARFDAGLARAHGFRREWMAFMSSLTDEWFLMAGACSIIFTIMVAFLRSSIASIAADPVTHSVVLLSLLTSLNGLCCTTMFFLFANQARSYDTRDAYHWTTGAVMLSSSRFDASILSAVPAASTMWSLALSSASFILYLARVYRVQNTPLPIVGDVVDANAAAFYHLPPAARIFVVAFAILSALHTIVAASYFMSFERVHCDDSQPVDRDTQLADDATSDEEDFPNCAIPDALTASMT